jgi:hypothetical protein
MTDVAWWRRGRVPAATVPAGIYGTIICASILASSDGGRPVKIAVVVIVTLSVYWLAERYAEVLGLATAADEGEPPGAAGAPKITVDRVRHVLRSGWSMIEVSVTPLLVMLGSRLLGADPDTAVNIALSYNVFLLVALGWLAATRADLVGWRRIAGTAVTAGLGLVVIGLKAALGH